MVLDWGFRCFNDIERNSTTKCIYTFSFLVGKHRKTQSINAKLFLPIIPIGIVAYAFTLLWDNLCRNSCILSLRHLPTLNNSIFKSARDNRETSGSLGTSSKNPLHYWRTKSFTTLTLRHAHKLNFRLNIGQSLALKLINLKPITFIFLDFLPFSI